MFIDIINELFNSTCTFTIVCKPKRLVLSGQPIKNQANLQRESYRYIHEDKVVDHE